MTQQTAETKVPSDIEVSKIPDENGIIESPTEPVKNRKLYWLNTTNKKIYIYKKKNRKLILQIRARIFFGLQEKIDFKQRRHYKWT